jgi:hypothetical protein
MSKNLYVVKQIANSFTKDLFAANYDPSTVGKEIGIGEFTVFPNCLRTANPMMDGTGKYITGLTKEQEQEYGEALGVDLSPRSEVWGLGRFRATISSPKTNEIVFNPAKAEDFVKIQFLLANGYVAPKKESIKEDPKYKETVFYFSNDAEEETRTMRVMELKEELGSEIYKMRHQKEKMLLVANKVGITVREAFTESTLYKLLVSYKDELKALDRMEAFKQIIDMKAADLQADYYVIQAIGKLIKYDADNGYYSFNNKVLGKNREEIVQELKKPANIETLATLISSYKKIIK